MRAISLLGALLLVVTACGGDSASSGKTSDSRTPDAGETPALDAGDLTDAQMGAEPEPDAAHNEFDASQPHDAGLEEDATTPDAGEEEPDASEEEPDASVEEPDAGPPAPLTDSQLAAAYEKKLRDCKVVTGAGAFNTGGVEDALDRCFATCVLDAVCSDLKGATCGTAAPNEPSAYGSCAGKCLKSLTDQLGVYPSDGFTCGAGKVIPHAAVCDDGLVLDCNALLTFPKLVSDDEVGCETFTCKTGGAFAKKIAKRYRCDGLFGEANGGCADRSDEEGCATLCAP